MSLRGPSRRWRSPELAAGNGVVLPPLCTTATRVCRGHGGNHTRTAEEGPRLRWPHEPCRAVRGDRCQRDGDGRRGGVGRDPAARSSPPLGPKAEPALGIAFDGHTNPHRITDLTGSQVRRRGLRRRRERVQTEDFRHRRQFWAPRAPQPEHEGGDRGEGMAVDLSKINRPARAAARAEHVEPRRPRDQRGPDRRRPQHVAAGGKLLVPALDDGLRLGARGSIGNLPLGAMAMSRPRVRMPIAAVSCESRPQSTPVELAGEAAGQAAARARKRLGEWSKPRMAA